MMKSGGRDEGAGCNRAEAQMGWGWEMTKEEMKEKAVQLMVMKRFH